MYKYLLILIVIFSISCSSDEKTINPIDTSQKIMISLADAPVVSVISIPENTVIIDNILSGNLSVTLNFPITYIREFGDYLYLSAQKDHKLVVLDKKTYQQKVIIDFSEEQAEVGQIIFPNSTDCYIIHPNKNIVTILDITVFKKARTIECGNNPSSISVSGNQVFVTNLTDNSISVIDTRTRQEEAKINSSPFPSFSTITSDGNYAAIISIGNGKIDNNLEKTPAILSFINITQRSESNYLEIGEGLIAATDIIPVGMAYTNSDWIFIATRSSLFRVDAKNKKDIKFIVRRSFLSVINDEASGKLILTAESDGRNEILLASNKTGSISNTIKTLHPIQYIIPWR